MESSRNGSLTALLMFLPLVAVPVIALLRPPPQLDGAAEKSDSENSLDQFASEFLSDAPPADTVVENPRAQGGYQAEDDWLDPFGNEPVPPVEMPAPPQGSNPSTGAGTEFAPTPQVSTNPFHEVPPVNSDAAVGGTDRPSADPFPQATNPPAADPTTPAEVVAQLRELGVTRYQWLPVRANQGFGFAAFVAGPEQAFTVRFSSVHPTRQGAVLDVVQQIAAWKMRTGSELNSRDNSTGAANGFLP